MTGIREKLQSSTVWRQIEEEFLATGNAAAVLNGLTDATDTIARGAYRTSIEPICLGTAAMLAVGAYGRRETFPYSGADIVILLDRSAESESVKGALAGFARLLRDAGLRLNYSVRTVAECLEIREQNLELIVNLLDRRFLAGDPAIETKLEGRLPTAISRHARDIAEYIARSARMRHSRYRNTAHHLEPDVMEAPGGLRDLRLIDWFSRLNSEDQPPRERLKDAALYPTSARCFLHYHTERDANVLDFATQDGLAGQPFTCGKMPFEWMREYLRNARLVFNEARRALDASERRNSSLLDNFREYRTRLSNAEFTVSRDRLLLRSPAQLDRNPELVLRMLEFVARHGVPPAPETERRLEAAAPLFTAWCAQPRPLWPALKNILSFPHAGMSLRALENARLLAALFPEWDDIADLPAPEPELYYTLDEHTLGAIQCIDGLQTAADPGQRQFSELFSEVDNPALLRFALLFHQMGRGPGESSRTAAERAKMAMVRIEMPASDIATVEFLIDHRRDLAAAMTPWRLEQLSRAYSATRQELTRELETGRIQQIPEDLPGRAGFMKGFPVRYLRAHPPEEIEAHLRLFELSRPTGVAAELDRIEGAYRLTIVARDRPSLFTSFAGAITSFGLDILKAEAFSNAQGIILDTFVFADPKRILNPTEVDRLQDLIQRIALGKIDVSRLMRNYMQPELKKRITPPRVQFDSDACESATLVEIVAEDRPGLLYSLATVFSSNNCNIDIVLIDTKGHRAIDVFYVAYQGHKLSSEMQGLLQERLLAAC